MKIIDTHAHINEERLYKIKEEVVKRAKENGVVKVINNADSLASFKVIKELARDYPDFCYSALGFFPDEGPGTPEESAALLEKEIQDCPNLVAIGEIGLDYHMDNSKETKTRQKELFKAQIEIAKKHNLPIIVHSRDAEADTFNTIIDSHIEQNVTLHCFSGSFQMALRYLRHKKNIYFGIGGVLTFKNARSLQEVVLRVPSDHFVLETDSPFLTPEPFRGTLNEPSKIVFVLKKMAELLNRDPEELGEEIYQRSLKIYNIHE